MTKTECINQLCKQWKTIFNFKEGDFYADGIINEELYNRSPAGKKLLFITKEPNATNHEKNPDRSFITEWNNENPAYPFAQRIAEWTYGVFNDFPPFDEIPHNKNQFLRHIAFMNVKKSGGKGLAIHQDIYTVARQQRELINKQISIIEPEIIITGLSSEKVRNTLWPNVEWKTCGYSVLVGRNNNAKIIDFYHPSCRAAPAATYSLLQNVIRSNSFKNL
jgi:hypothetical protein